MSDTIEIALRIAASGDSAEWLRAEEVARELSGTIAGRAYDEAMQTVRQRKQWQKRRVLDVRIRPGVL